MTGRVKGKVAFVTGAARGQGRSHAVRLAEEGADVIAVDLCKDIESNQYPLSRAEDLDETVRLVEAAGGRIVAVQADVRERSELRAAVEQGVRELGGLDIVVANAGISPMRSYAEGGEAGDFVDATDVDLIGAMNAVAVSIPHLRDHGSVVITGSTAGMMKGAVDNPLFGPGGAGYMWSKRTLIGYTEQMALHLASKFIRVNCIHPTNVNTHLVHNKEVYSVFRPDLENPTREDVMPSFMRFHAMPIPYVEPIDISNMVLFLSSDEARYVTGQQIRVDAGSLLKSPARID
ncbi:mycofactocin-coupled SDR family oxidoreductase [Nocardioides sp. cx-173]|uniref:mycofactocin-coupled SDR family oxidoreductase n=1 Tax=Nocardioides sp. cx-173 TaxID=2898796 RepID=UPI001E584112|nr:mycofactocin-coupled SDR family oxidoreductase [Nocardioides sp. cx-173]MCD4524291.1 mycofactocin-coupled SDR family oxidoreductase [Nocardioides sp. cx-173]UGB41683.1 mycofactocin-coupled SDR family oxidoreductase [Nocardioides sp. cx-173]